MSEKDIIDALNLIVTIVFAVSGAVVAVQRNMDLFGALVLAFVTAVAGGIGRDVVIGAIPPDSIANWQPAAIAAAAGLFAFCCPSSSPDCGFPFWCSTRPDSACLR